MATESDTKRLVLIVPSDFHRTLKVAAAQRGLDMRDLVVSCVSECLSTSDRTTETRAAYEAPAAPRDGQGEG